MESGETAVTMEQIGKNFTAETNKHGRNIWDNTDTLKTK
jgi:hypothetical protein